MAQTKTDCRTDVGVTVQLIDTIINQARLLRVRSMTSAAVKEALKDMSADEDVRWIFAQAGKVIQPKR